MRPVILVSIDWCRPQDGKTSLGIASIAAALKAAQVQYTMIAAQINSPEFSLETIRTQLLHAIDRAGPGCLVGFSTYVWNDGEIQHLLREAKHRGASVVLGGPQISYMPKGQLEGAYPQADYFVRGQGELAMVALATGTAPEGYGIHKAGTPDRGQKAEHDLLDLPSPYLLGTVEPTSSLRWETQRGCPFKCAFCQHREPGSRLIHQRFADYRLEQELTLFAAALVKRISVLDPIFHTSPARAIEVLSAIKAAGVSAKLALQCRFETCTEEFLNALEGLDVTLEFGLQTTIEAEYRAIARPNKMALIGKKIRELHERQLDFEVSLIYGLPHQTLTSFRTSVQWCQDSNVPRLRAWPLMLLRGTPLYEQQQHYGFKESTGTRIPIVVASNSFTEDEHIEMARIATALEGY